MSAISLPMIFITSFLFLYSIVCFIKHTVRREILKFEIERLKIEQIVSEKIKKEGVSSLGIAESKEHDNPVIH